MRPWFVEQPDLTDTTTVRGHSFSSVSMWPEWEERG